MKTKILLFCLCLFTNTLLAQVAIQTSFETSPNYTGGTINNQNNWSVTAGTANVSTSNAKTGTQALNLSASNAALTVNYVPYNGSVAGLQNTVYADMWIKPISFATKGIAINGYDLFAGSAKRIFVIEFTTDNLIKAYNGSTSQQVATWTANQWVRVSVKANLVTEKYEVAINGATNSTVFNLRETYIPTASGTRSATVKEFHSLRINHGTDTQIASSSSAIDDLYIGTNPIPGLFGSTTNPLTVTQPQYGTITLHPSTFSVGDTVFASLNLPSGCYQFNGWTGSVSGPEISKQIIITSASMTLGANVVLTGSAAPVKRSVNTVALFKSALTAMNPGDTIEVDNGTYNMGSVKITRTGCSSKPIIIKAKNTGQAIINGNSPLVFESVKYVTMKGFSFQLSGVGTGIKILNSKSVRITQNNINITETAKCVWLFIGDTGKSTAPLKSGDNRIDYNIISGKTQAGQYIIMDGNLTQQSQHDTIAFNLIKNNGPRVDNGQESIRIGVSGLSQSSGYTVVEYNLFEDCDGDPEIVSVKSCDNTIRYNTFKRCLGTLCLRQGNRSTVEGNYFFGEGKTASYTDPSSGNVSTIGCGGVRIYGKDHKVINNYFHGLTGSTFDAACTITNGDAYNVANPTNLAAHYVPENLVFAFNTFAYNKSNIEIGYKYDKAPINCLLANNIVVDTLAPIIKSYSSTSLAGLNFSNNIMYPTKSSSLGVNITDQTKIKNVDPKLVLPVCSGTNCNLLKASKVYRISSGSPAKDAATGTYSYVLKDFEQQVRSGIKDIGADEYLGNSTITFCAFDQSYVGPSAIPFTYSYTIPAAALSPTATTREKLLIGESLSPTTVYPNPASNYTIVDFGHNVLSGAQLIVYNMLGLPVKKIANLSGRTQRIDLNQLPSGVYQIVFSESGEARVNLPLVIAH